MTVVIAAVLAILFMYVLLSIATSGWNDPVPSPGATDGLTVERVLDV